MSNRIVRAINIQRSLGTRVATGYLRNQKVSIEMALWVLVHRG